MTLAESLPSIVAGALAGGFVNGLAGFGTALFALGFFLSVMDPVQAVAVTLVLSFATGLQGAWLVRREIGSNPGRLARFLVPGLAGIPFGLAILVAIDATTLKLVVGAFLVLYGGLFSLRSTLPTIANPPRILDALVGFAGGTLGAAASLSGALPTMWTTMRPWTKEEIRAVLQPFNMTILGLSAAALAFRGVYDRETAILLAVALPSAMVAAQAGLLVFRRLSNTAFRRLLIVATLASGVGILLRELAAAL